MGIEIAAHRLDLLAVLNPLNHPQTNACVSAERRWRVLWTAVAKCRWRRIAPSKNGMLKLRGFVGRPNGSEILEAEAEAPIAYAEDLGNSVAENWRLPVPKP